MRRRTRNRRWRSLGEQRWWELDGGLVVVEGRDGGLAMRVLGRRVEADAVSNSTEVRYADVTPR